MNRILAGNLADQSATPPASNNSAARVDNAAALAQSDFSSVDAYTAPYVLLAALQGNVKLTDKQVTALISALKNNMNGGLFSYEWGGVTYHDPDTAGAALAALAAYYGKRDDATAVVDAILAALPAAMNENGSFGSANIFVSIDKISLLCIIDKFDIICISSDHHDQ